MCLGVRVWALLLGRLLIRYHIHVVYIAHLTGCPFAARKHQGDGDPRVSTGSRFIRRSNYRLRLGVDYASNETEPDEADMLQLDSLFQHGPPRERTRVPANPSTLEKINEA